MYLFSKKIVIFCLLSFFISFVPFYIYMHSLGISFKNLPAPKISNSFAYNEKMAFLRKKQADIMSFGSSVCLHDLYADSITKYFHTKSYLNTSSWGLSMKDTYELLKLYSTIGKPNTVIIASSIFDYTANDKIVDYTDLRLYLITSGYNSAYFKNINLLYMLSEMKEYKNDIFQNNPYNSSSLLFDSYGSIVTLKDSSKIDPIKRELKLKEDMHRFNLEIGDINEKKYEHNFSYLDSIISLCKKNNLSLYYIQTPLRAGLYSNLSKKIKDILLKHSNREQNTILNAGYNNVNGNNRIWDDSLFVDSYHFNVEGAKLFTSYCFSNYKR